MNTTQHYASQKKEGQIIIAVPGTVTVEVHDVIVINPESCADQSLRTMNIVTRKVIASLTFAQ